jgi:hypothetical protein
LQELKAEALQQRRQVEELESVVRLKQAEVEMFEVKASEARQEAERLRLRLAKSAEKAGQDYVSLYLNRRLEEAEAEKQCIFEKIKLQENQQPVSSRGLGAGDPSADDDAVQDRGPAEERPQHAVHQVLAVQMIR